MYAIIDVVIESHEPTHTGADLSESIQVFFSPQVACRTGTT